MAEFDALIGPLLDREGGYSNHPNDRGGATNHGITQTTYAQWCSRHGQPWRNVSHLTRAEAVRVYWEMYWTPSRCSDLPHAIRAIHFDAAVNHGITRAAKLLQQACSVEEDGVIGPVTLAAARDIPAAMLRSRYLVARYRFYGQIINRDKSQRDFIAGWMNRMEEFA